MKWSCEVFKLLSVRNWEGEYFLYNPLTTQTHILNELGWRVLYSCADGPVSQERLLSKLAGTADDPERDKFTDTLSAHLDQLSRLGLLEGS